MRYIEDQFGSDDTELGGIASLRLYQKINEYTFLPNDIDVLFSDNHTLAVNDLGVTLNCPSDWPLAPAWEPSGTAIPCRVAVTPIRRLTWLSSSVSDQQADCIRCQGDREAFPFFAYALRIIRTTSLV